MEKLSQRELHCEGFWSNFAKPFKVGAGIARGAIAGAAKAVDYALPELTKPLQGLEAAGRDIARTAKNNYERYADTDHIAANLEEAGYQIDFNAEVKPVGDNKLVTAYRIIRFKPNGESELATTPTTFLIDKQGNILKRVGR